MQLDLSILKQHKNIKEISDIIDEINEVRDYQERCDKTGAYEYIQKLVAKYPVERAVHNMINQNMPKSLDEDLFNAEVFLFNLGIKKMNDISKK